MTEQGTAESVDTEHLGGINLGQLAYQAAAAPTDATTRSLSEAIAILATRASGKSTLSAVKDHCLEIYIDGRSIALVIGRGHGPDSKAARLVACWNALDGIPDPTALRTQRDALLAACGSALEYLGKIQPIDEEGLAGCLTIKDKLRAAIALCPEGGAP